MFGDFKRRNNRKQRLSAWFASERDGDMQSLDVRGVFSSLIVYAQALLRKRTLDRSNGADVSA